jgi:hypothetical protein
VTEIEIVIMTETEADSSAVTSSVTNIDEDDFVETADSKLASKNGLEVDEVTGGAFSGVAALVPTAFLPFCHAGLLLLYRYVFAGICAIGWRMG